MKIILTELFISFSTLLFAQPGALDLAFGNNGMVTTPFGQCVKGHAIALNADGKIFIAGSYRTDPGSYKKNTILLRYNSDGTLDNTFNSDGIVTADLGDDDEINAMLIQPNGKIVLAGFTGNSIDHDDVMLIRYTTDGLLDSTFDNDGVAIISLSSWDDKASSVALQEDGKIIVVGTLFNGSDDDYFITRLNSNGTPDNLFGVNGVVQVDYDNKNQEGESVKILEDGKIVVGGYSYESSQANFMLARFTSTGSRDTSFGVGGKSLTDVGSDDHAYSMTIQPDGKILQNGYTFGNYNSDIALVRYNSDGTVDYSFGASGIVTRDIGGPEDDSRSIDLQSDGKILLAGYSRFPTGTDFILLRFNADGTPDSTFDEDGIVVTDFGQSSAYAFASAIQTNQEILLVGVSDLTIAVARYEPGLELGVVDFTQQNVALIYPNPVTSQAGLEYKLIKDATISIKLYDMNGRLIQTFFENQNRKKGVHHEALKLNEPLLAGNYFVSVSNGSESVQVQISKQ